jgi:hypothetical protein
MPADINLIIVAVIFVKNSLFRQLKANIINYNFLFLL